MPFKKKRGDAFEKTILELIKICTYAEIAKMRRVTRSVVSGIVKRSRPGNKEREKLRMRERRGSKK